MRSHTEFYCNIFSLITATVIWLQQNNYIYGNDFIIKIISIHLQRPQLYQQCQLQYNLSIKILSISLQIRAKIHYFWYFIWKSILPSNLYFRQFIFKITFMSNFIALIRWRNDFITIFCRKNWNAMSVAYRNSST